MYFQFLYSNILNIWNKHILVDTLFQSFVISLKRVAVHKTGIKAMVLNDEVDDEVNATPWKVL